MGLIQNIKNALVPGSDETEQLMEWLGIDPKQTKAINETTYFT